MWCWSHSLTHIWTYIHTHTYTHTHTHTHAHTLTSFTTHTTHIHQQWMQGGRHQKARRQPFEYNSSFRRYIAHDTHTHTHTHTRTHTHTHTLAFHMTHTLISKYLYVILMCVWAYLRIHPRSARDVVSRIFSGTSTKFLEREREKESQKFLTNTTRSRAQLSSEILYDKYRIPIYKFSKHTAWEEKNRWRTRHQFVTTSSGRQERELSSDVCMNMGWLRLVGSLKL